MFSGKSVLSAAGSSSWMHWAMALAACLTAATALLSAAGQEGADVVTGWTEAQVEAALGLPSLPQREPDGSLVWYYDGTSKGTAKIFFAAGKVVRIVPSGVGAELLRRAKTSRESLRDAIRNVQRYVERDTVDNSKGGGSFGPEIQFDTRGVEFGPWIRRFVPQVKRNWLVPSSAMSNRGHVAVTFNVHKDGSITDVVVASPDPFEVFNTAAFAAVNSSNPTAPLPPEYPADQAFFTVTFYYNERPPR